MISEKERQQKERASILIRSLVDSIVEEASEFASDIESKFTLTTGLLSTQMELIKLTNLEDDNRLLFIPKIIKEEQPMAQPEYRVSDKDDSKDLKLWMEKNLDQQYEAGKSQKEIVSRLRRQHQLKRKISKENNEPKKLPSFGDDSGAIQMALNPMRNFKRVTNQRPRRSIHNVSQEKLMRGKEDEYVYGNNAQIIKISKNESVKAFRPLKKFNDISIEFIDKEIKDEISEKPIKIKLQTMTSEFYDPVDFKENTVTNELLQNYMNLKTHLKTGISIQSVYERSGMRMKGSKSGVHLPRVSHKRFVD